MAADRKLLDLIGNIYDCAIEPKNWPETLERMLGYVGGQAAAISLQDPLTREVRLVSQWGISPDFEKSMMEGMAINPLISMGWYSAVDEPFTGEVALGRDAYLKTRFYNEIIAPAGYYDAALTVLAKSTSRFGSLSVPAASPISQTTLHRLRQLAPHVRRAVSIADLLDVRALQNDMLSAAFDLLTIGIILVDDRCRIVHSNATGTRLLDEGSTVRRDDGCLSCRDPKTATELTLAIRNAAGESPVDFPKSGIALPISAVDNADIAAWILPLDRGLRSEFATSFSASVAVFLRKLGETSPFPGELFVKQFGISPAECRVLMMLTQGMTVREAAIALGISEPTAKTHLQKLFQKTGTDRQANLIGLTMSAISPATG